LRLQRERLGTHRSRAAGRLAGMEGIVQPLLAGPRELRFDGREQLGL
jgi:hypothetical protein